MKCYWVYILATKKNGTLYIGVTNNLSRRVYEHREKLMKGFTNKYTITQLVYAKSFQNIDGAIRREKCIKRWKRAWKIKLIEELNPDWKNLYEIIL